MIRCRLVAGYKNDGTGHRLRQARRRPPRRHGVVRLGADGKRNDSSVDRGLLGMNHEATTDEKLSSFFPARQRRHQHAAAPRVGGGQGAGHPRRVGGGNAQDRRANGLCAGLWPSTSASPRDGHRPVGPARGNALMVTSIPNRRYAHARHAQQLRHRQTPWGTLLTGGELERYFFRSATDDAARGNDKSVTALKRYGRPQGGRIAPWLGDGRRRRQVPRWNNSKTGTSANGSDDYRNEMNAQGYIVEIDPNQSPQGQKRTGLGRFATRALPSATPWQASRWPCTWATMRATSTSTSG